MPKSITHALERNAHGVHTVHIAMVHGIWGVLRMDMDIWACFVLFNVVVTLAGNTSLREANRKLFKPFKLQPVCRIDSNVLLTLLSPCSFAVHCVHMIRVLNPL